MFIQRDESAFGFGAEDYISLEKLMLEFLKSRWVQAYIGKSFIEKSILEWLRISWRESSSDSLSEFFTKHSEASVKDFTMWAPISDLEIGASFDFGPVSISTMDPDFFDKIEFPSVASSPQQAGDIKALFSKLRNEMQGLAAIVFKTKAEKSYIFEKGLALASDAIGLLRFLSPAANCFGVLCPNSLLGMQVIPSYNAIVLGENGSFTNQSGLLPKDIAHWQLSEHQITSLKERGLQTLGRLVSDENLTDFQSRLRMCLLTYSKGTTLSEVADRLVYTCSSLESFLLRDTSEPIQQNLGERMAFLLTADPTERSNIVANVRQAYSIKSRYIHHRSVDLEETTLTIFTANAYRVFLTALNNIDNIKTSIEFIDAIDRIKFGG